MTITSRRNSPAPHPGMGFPARSSYQCLELVTSGEAGDSGQNLASGARKTWLHL